MGTRAHPSGPRIRDRLTGGPRARRSNGSPLFGAGYPARDGGRTGRKPLFFELSSWALALVLFAIVIGATAVGLFLGRRTRDRSDHLHKPVGSLQTAVLGVVGLVLAFGLALAVGRYELRRAAVVDEANAIGTTFLRAQTLAEPQRSDSLELLVRYTDTSIRLSHAIPGSPTAAAAIADGARLQRELWRLAGQVLVDAPIDSAPRLYVESLNEMIDLRTTRVSVLGNRVPGPVLTLEVVAAALALGLLAFYLALLGRGSFVVLIAAGLVCMLLLVTFDLDRPTRGLIDVPSTPLDNLRASMSLPPAATGPTEP